MATKSSGRMRIGILLTGDYAWAGGLYYSLTAIKLLQSVSLQQNIQVIVLINNNTAKELLKEIQLPNIEVVNLSKKNYAYKVICKMMSYITKSDFRFKSDINSEKLDILFPLTDYDNSHAQLNCRLFYWLFDFQHKFLPDLFSKQEIEKRDKNFALITNHAKNIVVSSEDSKQHLIQFYPECKSNIYVYKFVSLITPKIEITSDISIAAKKYFIVSNQFWPHKNHIVVLKAAKILKTRIPDLHIIFTGKYSGEKSKKYYDDLQHFIHENELNSALTFTGFIEREEQIKLITNAIAVIQPSKFEGWSTVIEDAKALNKLLVVSDLAIHREQVKKTDRFFNADDDNKLASHLVELWETKDSTLNWNYENDIVRAKNELESIFGIG